MGKGEKEARGRRSLHVTLRLPPSAPAHVDAGAYLGFLGCPLPLGIKRQPKAGDSRKRSQPAKGHTVSAPVPTPDRHLGKSSPAALGRTLGGVWAPHWTSFWELGDLKASLGVEISCLHTPLRILLHSLVLFLAFGTFKLGE